MDMEDIIDYVTTTPENPNPNVLRTMISTMLSTFAGLADVDITDPSDKQFLYYDIDSHKWVNGDLSDLIIIT